MTNKQKEPIQLDCMHRRSRPWIYVLAGAVIGAIFEVVVCEPLNYILGNIFNYFHKGYPLQLNQALSIIFRPLTWPGTSSTGLIYGAALGLLYWRIKEHRLRLETMNQELQRQTRYLNTYMTVSSMVAQCLDPQELLEAVLNVTMETVSAEGASVLLLDEDQANFRFYSIEGPAKQCLMAESFPADKGIAGLVMQTQRSEVVNDIQQDPRFSKRFDSKYGLITRNLIAIPLTAGEEKIGVMEVVNKAGGEPFTDEERLLLDSIAEEIAFAIRNARIFEYVVNSYCLQRQGQMSCKGCKRPLRSWTPCVKYLEKGL